MSLSQRLVRDVHNSILMTLTGLPGDFLLSSTYSTEIVSDVFEGFQTVLPEY